MKKGGGNKKLVKDAREVFAAAKRSASSMITEDSARIERITKAMAEFSELSAEEVLVDINEIRADALQRIRQRADTAFEDDEGDDEDGRAQANRRKAMQYANEADQALVLQASKLLIAHLPKPQHHALPAGAAPAVLQKPGQDLSAMQMVQVLRNNRVESGKVHGPEDEPS